MALAFQYHFLFLLRHGMLKYLVLWGIPLVWLFYNGLMGINLLLTSSTDTAFTGGWLSPGDLIGFVAGAVFLPLLAGFGVIIAIVDSNSGLAALVCHNADTTLRLIGITTANIISYSLHLAAVIWEQIANSFCSGTIILPQQRPDPDRDQQRQSHPLPLLDPKPGLYPGLYALLR